VVQLVLLAQGIRCCWVKWCNWFCWYKEYVLLD
jgi:hypothetical protein